MWAEDDSEGMKEELDSQKEEEENETKKAENGKIFGDEEEDDECSEDSSGDEFDADELMDIGQAISRKDDEADDEAGTSNNPKEEKEDDGRKEEKRKGLNKKQRLRKHFDAEFDQTNEQYNALKDEMDQQSKVGKDLQFQIFIIEFLKYSCLIQLNKGVFENLDEEERQYLEGIRPGLYVRIEVDDIPAAFVECFDPTFPYIVGGLLPGEQNNGYIQVNVEEN